MGQITSMTTVTIQPIATGGGETGFGAISGKHLSLGKSAGEALDRLSAELTEGDDTLVVLQRRRPDQHFAAGQIERLDALMSRWHQLRDAGEPINSQDRSELEELIVAELNGTGDRTEEIERAVR